MYIEEFDEKNIKVKTSIAQNSGNLVSSISELIGLMSTVMLDSPDAELNATTITDGLGGRILL